jgi:glutaminase
MDNSVIALLRHGVSAAPAGKIILLKVALRWLTYPHNPLINAGATQVYDEANQT